MIYIKQSHICQSNLSCVDVLQPLNLTSALLMNSREQSDCSEGLVDLIEIDG